MSAEHQLGQLLRSARVRTGLSRGDLAQLADLDASYVYRIETGNRRPSRESLMALAEALGVNGDTINEWLMAAGYAPASLLASVRAAADSRDGEGQRLSGSNNTQLEVSHWGRWLEAMGLHEAAIGRLLRAMGTTTPMQQREIAASIYSVISRVTVSLEVPVHTAVIPAAGGQHQLLAPHVMQRLVLGAIGEAVESGISNIVLVLAPGMVESLYTPIKATLDLTTSPPIKLSYCQQPEPLGLGDAILQAETFVNPKPFAVLLPDDVLRERKRTTPTTLLHQMMDAFTHLGCVNLVAVTSVPRSKMWKYGIAKLSAKSTTANVRSIKQLMEKPDHDQSISRSAHAFGIVGRYLLLPDIFPTLRALKESNGRLLQLTDALEYLRREGNKIYAFEMGAIRQDIGEVLGQASELIRSAQATLPE